MTQISGWRVLVEDASAIGAHHHVDAAESTSYPIDQESHLGRVAGVGRDREHPARAVAVHDSGQLGGMTAGGGDPVPGSE